VVSTIIPQTGSLTFMQPASAGRHLGSRGSRDHRNF
jgi:hypothetical protein